MVYPVKAPAFKPGNVKSGKNQASAPATGYSDSGSALVISKYEIRIFYLEVTSTFVVSSRSSRYSRVSGTRKPAIREMVSARIVICDCKEM